MTSAMKNEVSKMNEAELNAAIRVLRYQVNAKLFVGNRKERQDVLKYLTDEKQNREFPK